MLSPFPEGRRFRHDDLNKSSRLIAYMQVVKPKVWLLEDSTYAEVAARLRAGWTRILVPMGATEQHGPGLPLNVDTLHGCETCVRAARLLRRVLVGPVVSMGYSPEHRAFPGTISLRHTTLAALIEDVAASLARSGFDFVYFWFGHGGDAAVFRKLQPKLERRFRGCFVTGTRDVARYVADTWDKYPMVEGIPAEVAGSHAGEFEASMLAAIRPDLLRRSKLAAGDRRPLSAVARQMLREGIHRVSPNGVLGDQRRADAGRGERYLGILAEWLARDFRRELARARYA